MVTVNASAGKLAPSPPRELFTVPWDGELVGNAYAVAPDGQRFLVRATRDTGLLTAEVIINWPALVKRGEAAAR